MDPHLIAPVLVMLIGAAVAFGGARDAWFGVASNAWPTTTAKVLGSYVGRTHLLRGNISIAMVTYEYVVDGERHRSDRYSFDGSGAGFSAGRVASGHERGREVTVYYDPDRPGRACLVPGSGGTNYATMGFGGVIVWIGWTWFTGSPPV